jgi:hypothetical protein
MPSDRSRKRVHALTLAVALVQLGRLILLVRLPPSRLVQFIPDDAFYYLVLARNFASTGRWTFDGVEPASGFHLLWGYLLAALYALRPNLSLAHVVLASGLVQWLSVVVATYLTALVAERILGPRGILGLAAIFLSAASLDVGLGMMEAALVMLASAATLWLLCRAVAPPTWGRTTLALAALLGFTGMLARSDFGLLPACLFAMHVFLWRKRTTTAVLVRLSGSVLAGSVTAFLVILLHTHWISGQWLQASAQQKLFWGQILGFSFADTRTLLLTLVAPPASVVIRTPDQPWIVPLWTWTTVATLAAGVVLAWRTLDRMAQTVVVALVATIAAYMVVYRFDGASGGPWYLGVFVVPLALLAGTSFRGLFAHLPRPAQLLLAGLCLVGVKDSLTPSRVWQQALYYGGLYIHEHPELRPVASWNAGAVGYFAGGGVTNIDGLVNDRILPYAKAGTLLDYMERRRIRTIVDYDAMFRPAAKLSGGYMDGKLQACVEPLDFLAHRPQLQGFSRVMVFRMKPECVADSKR